MITLAQITHGDARCVYCDQDADVTIATGADPEPEPMCWTHARSMFDMTLRISDKLFPAIQPV